MTEVRYKRAEKTIKMRDGSTREVNAYDPGVGLFVHKNRFGNWMVTHHEGTALFSTRTLRGAKVAISQLIELIDWTGSSAEINAALNASPELMESYKGLRFVNSGR